MSETGPEKVPDYADQLLEIGHEAQYLLGRQLMSLPEEERVNSFTQDIKDNRKDVHALMTSLCEGDSLPFSWKIAEVDKALFIDGFVTTFKLLEEASQISGLKLPELDEEFRQKFLDSLHAYEGKSAYITAAFSGVMEAENLKLIEHIIMNNPAELCSGNPRAYELGTLLIYGAYFQKAKTEMMQAQYKKDLGNDVKGNVNSDLLFKLINTNTETVIRQLGDYLNPCQT